MGGRATPLTIVLGAAGVLAAACAPSSPTSGPLGDTNPIATVDGGGGPPPRASADGGSDDAALDDATSAFDAGDNQSPTDAARIDARLNDGQAEGDGASPPTVDSGLPSGPPRCDPARLDAGPGWTAVGRVASAPQTGFGRFGGISIDELTIAWTSPTGGIYVADRPARAGAFGSPSVVDTTSAPVASDRVALAPSRLVLFAISADHGSFVAFNRTSAGAPWSPSAPLQFVNVDAMAAGDRSGQFSEPVLGADGTSLFYLLASAGAPPALYESTWDTPQHAWTAGVALPNPELASTAATLRRRATGASSDGRTLFFFDETTGQERAAWRDTTQSPFVEFMTVPGIAEAAPNYLCDTLYFQATDSSGAGAFIAQ
jgi:hypothetical protein